MSRSAAFALGILVSAALLGAANHLPTASAQEAQATNYLVISVYDPAPGRSYNDAEAEMAEIVRIHRGSGAYKSIRLFTHAWGSESAFYMIAEPNDWASIPKGFEAQMEAQPDLLDRPDEWEAHDDNILVEVPVS